MKKLKSIISQWLKASCIGFTCTVIIYMIITSAFGVYHLDISYLLGLLLMCVAGTLTQLVCFSDKIIKKMRYTRRLLLFSVMFLPLLSAIALIFKWFPTEVAASWITFFVIFLAVFIIVTLCFEVHYKISGKKYDGLLGEYKSRHGNENDDEK